MALTSNDETDLLLPLYRGVMETERFSQFLERLKRRTGAAHVALHMQRIGGPAPHLSPLRPNRVYTLTELTEIGASIEPGFADMRMVRIPVAPNISGILTLARAMSCSASDSALLSNLAPYVEAALTMLLAMERDRLEASLSAGALSRSGTGWIMFDADARILAIETETRQRLAQLTGIEPRGGEHLRAINAAAERRLAETAGRFAKEPAAPVDSVVLGIEPRCDAVLVPAPEELRQTGGISPFSEATMIAYCRFEQDESSERTAHLSRLFAVSLREAELAIALADGLSIAEAAEAMGLTLETARNYSKRLYAQLGVRGQTELVRLVHRSSAVLA